MIKNGLKIPTTIFSGFLGSGKTTIITSLVNQLIENGEKVAYVKNEIGEEDVDSKIIQGKNIKTRELLNGCICCTLVGPFIRSINELVGAVKPDRILIEASGASDPSAIALMVSSHPLLVRDGVVGVIDVINFEGYMDLSETARSQAKFTDLLVFNKVELADLQRKQAVVGYVRELNEHSPIVETKKGEIDTDIVFGVSSKFLKRMLSGEPSHNHHLKHDDIQSFHCDIEGGKVRKKLIKFLENLPKNIIRVKGFLRFESGQLVAVNKVGKRVSFDELDAQFQGNVDNDGGKLVFIGFGVKNLREIVCKKLKDI